LPESIGHIVACDDVTQDEMIQGILFMQKCSQKKTIADF
jgi:hypothetical protein